MASKYSLNAENLEVLGSARLAELLYKLSIGNNALARRLRMEIRMALSPKTAVKTLLKRLESIRGEESYLPPKRGSELAEELDAFRQSVLTHLLPVDANSALYAMLKLVSLARPLQGRVYKYYIHMNPTLCRVASDLAVIAEKAQPLSEELISEVFEADIPNCYRELSYVLESLGPLLEGDGMRHLRTLYLQQKKDAEAHLRLTNNRDAEATGKYDVAREALRIIADALNDVDGFVEEFSQEERREAEIATAIASRMHEAERHQEALEFLDSAIPGWDGTMSNEWTECRISVLDAVGDYAAAEQAMWAYFEESLNPGVLRRLLRRLSEEQFTPTEHRAIRHAEASESLGEAVRFLLSWGAQDKAAALIIKRAGELSSMYSDLLSESADALREAYPLVSTLLYRQLVADLVKKKYLPYLKEAAGYLDKSLELAARIQDWGSFQPQDQFERELRERLCDEYRFWQIVDKRRSKNMRAR